MKIKVWICGADGNQRVEELEVSDDYLSEQMPEQPVQEEQPQ